MARDVGGASRLYLKALFREGTVSGLTDGQLLHQFSTRRGEAAEVAFAVLVERHGAMVLRTCQGILCDEHEAMDAFQASFLVLVRKAHSLWVRESLAPWLHRVACRTAGRVKLGTLRRRDLERRLAEAARGRAGGDDREALAAAVHEELDRLPDHYRIPLVLCDLEGRTCEEVARHLGCPVGTIASRLARGREQLRDRLTRRGLAPTAGLPGVASAVGPRAKVPVPPSLAQATVCAAMQYVARAPTAALPLSVAALVGGWNKAMSMLRSRIMATAVVLACCLVSGGVWLAAPSSDASPSVGQPPAASGAVPPGSTGDAKGTGGISWGEAVDGLQLGLEVAGNGPAARLGGSVSLVAWRRNLRPEPAKLAFRAGWFYTSPPLVVDQDGKPGQVALPPKAGEDVAIFDGAGKKIAGHPQLDPGLSWPVLELSLEPGRSIELNTVVVDLAPAGEERPADRPTARLTPGAWKFRLRGLSTSDPKLETGEAQVMVRRTAAPGDEAKAGSLDAAAKKLVGSWQAEDGAAGPIYLADGTGRNPDGSPFEWHLEGDLLVARRSSAQGRPGDWSRNVILFSRNAEEYRLLAGIDIENPGRYKQHRFVRLVADGKGRDMQF